jgi:hypothetical protein
MNGLIVGLVGQHYGMRFACLVYASVALYAVYFVAVEMPDTKPIAADDTVKEEI